MLAEFDRGAPPGSPRTGSRSRGSGCPDRPALFVPCRRRRGTAANAEWESGIRDHRGYHAEVPAFS